MLALCQGPPRDTSLPAPVRQECLAVLQKVASAGDFWVQVHAVEYLLELGHTKEARLAARTLEPYSSEPQKRIGIWRIKSRLPGAHRQAWLDSIASAYMNKQGSDRIHAAESLAKLQYCFLRCDPDVVAADLTSPGLLQAFVNWGAANPCSHQGQPAFDRLLDKLQGSTVDKKIAAYALSFFPRLPAGKWELLAERALAEPSSSEAYPYLLEAAVQHCPVRYVNRDPRARRLKLLLLSLERSDNRDARVQLCRALAFGASATDRQVLQRLLRLKDPLTGVPVSYNEDVQAAAAFALLQLAK